MRSKVCFVLFLSSFMLFALLSDRLYAQETAAFTGVVTDATGAAVPNAKVTVTSERTAAARSGITDGAGRYTIPQLQIGAYTITVDQPSFAQSVRRNVVLEVDQSRQVDFTLSAAGVTQTVQVSAAPIEVNTTSASLGFVVGPQETVDLPLNGRDFVQLAALAPGATSSTNPTTQFTGGPGNETSIRGSYSLSVGGSRENSTDWLLDGVDNNELTAGAIAILPSIDAIQEFKVLTYNYSAQYGARGGPTVLVTTKSGSNAYHGTAFEFVRNTLFDAKSYFAPTREPYHQNQFGASVGGPIKKDKTFFFTDFQVNQRHYGVTTSLQVPTALMRQGIFTESFPGQPAPAIYNPFSTYTDPGTGLEARQPFANNTIPSSYINPIAAQMIAFLPLPNVAGTLAGNYVATSPWTLTDREFDIRIDQTISNKDSFYGRFSYDEANSYEPSGCPGFCSNPSGYGSTETYQDSGRNAALSEIHIFSSNFINTLTVGYNRIFNYISSYGTGSNESAKLGIPGSDLGGDATGLVNTSLSSGFVGIGDSGFSPYQGGTSIYHSADSVVIIRGAHDITLGGEIRRDQLNTIGYGSQDGHWKFDNLFTAALSGSTLDSSTGSPIASFLLGLPRQGSDDQIFDGAERGRRWTEFRPYVEDDWKVTRNFTVNLGLAYNITTAQTEVDNRQVNFVFATGQFLQAGVNSGPTTGVSTYYGGVEPRIGLAWSPFGRPDWSVHAGYGIFHDSGWNLGTQGLWQNPPFVLAPTWYSNNIDPSTTYTLQQGFPIETEPTSTAGYVGSSLNFEVPNPHLGTVQQFNLNIQHSIASILFTAAYTGARSAHLITGGTDFNSPPPGLSGEGEAYSQYGNIECFCDHGMGRYDSFQFLAESKNIKHGLYFSAAYTFSKGFDNGLPDFQAGLYGAIYYPLPGLAPKADKGLSEIDLKNNFVGSVVWNVPVGRGQMFGTHLNRAADLALGNWQINGITHLVSGFPLFMTTAVNNSGTTLSNRPDRVCNGHLSKATISEWFDTSCFVSPAAGELGDTSRSSLFGPTFLNLDGSVFKTFPIVNTDHPVKLQFRSEFFNLFNHAQFAPPGTDQGGDDFGQVLSTVGNPRLIQFSAKLIF